MDKRFEIKALLFQEEGVWIAQCLDIDVAAQHEKLSEAKKRLIKGVVVHIAVSTENGIDVFRKKAPDKFWKMFEESDNELTPPTGPLIPKNLFPHLRVADLAHCA